MCYQPIRIFPHWMINVVSGVKAGEWLARAIETRSKAPICVPLTPDFSIHALVAVRLDDSSRVLRAGEEIEVRFEGCEGYYLWLLNRRLSVSRENDPEFQWLINRIVLCD